MDTVITFPAREGSRDAGAILTCTGCGSTWEVGPWRAGTWTCNKCRRLDPVEQQARREAAEREAAAIEEAYWQGATREEVVDMFGHDGRGGQ